MAAERSGTPIPNKPPMAAATRWAGQLVTLDWVVTSKAALKTYDSDPAEDCALNDDGSAYVEHLLTDEEWGMSEQLVSAASAEQLCCWFTCWHLCCSVQVWSDSVYVWLHLRLLCYNH